MHDWFLIAILDVIADIKVNDYFMFLLSVSTTHYNAFIKWILRFINMFV